MMGAFGEPIEGAFGRPWPGDLEAAIPGYAGPVPWTDPAASWPIEPGVTPIMPKVFPTAPRPTDPPTADQLSNIIYNETASLAGDQLQAAREAIGYVILNRYLKGTRDGVAGNVLSDEAQKAIRNKVPDAVQAYDGSRAAAEAVLAGTAPDLTLGAPGFNMRPNDNLRVNPNYQPPLPVHQQFGPFNNRAPSGTLPATGVYLNTYGYGPLVPRP